MRGVTRGLTGGRSRPSIRSVIQNGPAGPAVGAHRKGQDDMASLLMIVSRERPALYERLCQEFHGDAGVAVVLDRRFGERRRSAHGVSAEQRRADRRQQDIQLQLKRLGWATVPAGA